MEQQSKVLDQLAREWQDLVERELQLLRRLNDEWNDHPLDAEWFRKHVKTQKTTQ